MSTSVVHPGSADRSIGDLLHDLSDGTAQLIRQEIRLARTETAESLRTLAGGAVQLAVAFLLATCALGAAVTTIILVLSRYVLGGLTWLAALIVAVVLGIIAALVARTGMHAFSAAALVPDETTTSIKETAEWLKHPTKSDASSK